ncbi:laccase domain protein YfiH [bacterium BMS3Bbin07]|nr:laccase domain protein YfiH [bacterium BMS3Bbin07]HDH01614.1 peptidoglycan editing factor PgeF [Nitrospirota bacterium]
MIIPENLNISGLSAFFTGRNAGIETGPLSHLSGIPEEALYMPVQQHTDHVFVLEAFCRPETADAVVTAVKGILLGVRVADCVPILVYDREREIVGAVHAGWRGTAMGILGKTIKTMADRFSSRVDDILIAFGPSIRGCCYNVNEDVLSAVEAATGDGDYIIWKGNKGYIDLAFANRIQALSLGVPVENLWMSGECTYCLPGKFFSYRYSRTGKRQGGFIGIDY